MTDFDAAAYWETRYRAGGTSGAGSSGRLGEWKGTTVAQVLERHGVYEPSLIDWGVGDGQQARFVLQAVPGIRAFHGVDVSPSALKRARIRLTREDPVTLTCVPSKQRVVMGVGGRYDAALSLDVIMHLTSELERHVYMDNLFASAPFVVIYAPEPGRYEAPVSAHVSFWDWPARVPASYALIEHVENPYPYSEYGEEGSYCDFWIYEEEV